VPLAGATLTPGAEADHEVVPVMAAPPLVMVNSTSPVLALQAPLTTMLDLSQTDAAAVFVAVGLGVYVEVTTLAALAFCVPLKTVEVGVAVGVLVGIETLATGVSVGVSSSTAGTTGASVGGASTGGSSAGGTSTGGSSAGGASTGGASTGGASTGGSSTGGASTGGASTGGASTGGASTGGASTTGASVASAPEAPDRYSPPGVHDAIRSESMTAREIILKVLKRAFVFISTSAFCLIMAVMPEN